MLCELCSTLDVSHLLSEPASSQRIVLGTWQSIQGREQTCEFCRTLTASIRSGPWSLKGRLSLNDEFILTPKLTLTSHCTTEVDKAPSRVFRLQIQTEDCDAAGDVFLLGNDAHLINQSPLGHGRMLNSTTIDYRLVREWIEECQQSHEKCNNVTMLKRFDFMIPEQSMFIDVRRERIVDVITNCEYATLSHVWGECQLSLTTRSQLSQLKEIGSLSVRSLPPTIRDAMTLTRAIGIRYLWVDALCILQDDKEHKAKQIAQMHNIYAAATMTIVAAAANDANSGLPGVGSSARDLNQYITTLAGLRLAARQGFLNVSLNRSTYNKRAWTYQESSISHRLLYITSKGAFMQCCQSLRSEEIILEDRACMQTTNHDHTVPELSQRNIWRELTLRQPSSTALRSCTCIFHYQERFQKDEIPLRYYREKAPEDGSFDKTAICCRHCQDFLRSIDAEWHMYRDLVRGYTTRQLKFESDRIPAFAGIAGFLQKQFDTKFLFGLPEKFFDFALIWCSGFNVVVPPRQTGPDNFPSWSWASQTIYVAYPGDNWLTSEVDWYRIDSERGLRPVHGIKAVGTSQPLREDFRKPITAQQLHSNGLLSGIDTPGSALFGWCQIISSFLLKGDRLYDKHKRPFASSSGSMAGVVQFSDSPPPESNQQYTPVEVFPLSRSSFRPSIGNWHFGSHRINLLVISRQGNVATRLGITDIENVKIWQESEKNWMLIKLI